MNPVITKMEHFVIIVKDLYLFAMVTEMLLHRDVAAKAVGWFKPKQLKGWLCIHEYLRGKYLNKLEK